MPRFFAFVDDLRAFVNRRSPAFPLLTRADFLVFLFRSPFFREVIIRQREKNALVYVLVYCGAAKRYPEMCKFFPMKERADRRRGIIVVYYFIFDERGNGVEDGSEKVSGFMMPVLVVVIAIYSLTLKTREQTA